MYQVIDNQTNCAVGKPMISKRMARNKADRLDLEYGAIRYSVKGPIEPLPVAAKQPIRQLDELQGLTLWAAVNMLDNAADYLLHDAGERDVQWDSNLDDACKLLSHKADNLRTVACKAERLRCLEVRQ
jgi:hypothetical protein